MGAISLKNKSKSGNLTAPGDVDPGAMIPIATVTLSSQATNIDFTNIPQNYTHLQVRGVGNVIHTGLDYGDLSVNFNGDTGTNYTWTRMRGNSTNVGTDLQTTYASARAVYMCLTTSASSFYGSTIIDLLDYSNASKYKTMYSIGGTDFNASGSGIGSTASIWANTNPITSIRFSSSNGDFRANTTLALYGIKTAGA
jgi:hypothetical protein